MNQVKKTEVEKQSSNYLSKLYSENRRPITNYPKKLAKLIINRNKIKKNSNILDVGCGRGDMLKQFQQNNLNVEGVDLSEESINMLSPIKVYQKNLETDLIDGREEFYDVIFSKSLIEHLNSPLSFVKNCNTLLKSDGCLIIMTPSWYHHSFGPFYLDYTHVTPFTLHSLRDIGELAGFKKIEAEYFYQLPFTWNNKYLKLVPKLISFFKLPYYPMYEGLSGIRFPNEINKLIRFSREVMLYAVMRK
tara:strand:- start:1698 stop:2438 length:741 start_codon:yes stop_codon:yes gene_type:complete